MSTASTRWFEAGAFDIGNGILAVADKSIPVLASIDISSGDVMSLQSWELSPEHRAKPIASDVLTIPGAVFVSSPAAGGVVRIADNGAVDVIRLDADPGQLTQHGSSVWVVASPDWDEEARAEERSDPNRRVPVIWEEPSPEEIALYGSGPPGLALIGDDDESPPWSVPEWREEQGDDEPGYPPQPVWLIRADQAQRIHFDAECIQLSSTGDVIAVVCRLPTDPIVKHVEAYGSVSYRYSYSLLVGASFDSMNRVATVADGSHVACDEGDLWLLTWNGKDMEEPTAVVARIDLSSGGVGPSLPVNVSNPRTICSGYVVDLPSTSRSTEDQEVRIVPLQGTRGVSSRLGGFRWETIVKCWGDRAWIGPLAHGGIIALDHNGSVVFTLPLEIDVTVFAPDPTRPAGLVPREFESRMLEDISQELRGGWTKESGEMRPLIAGVSFESIELEGSFPDSEIVALFRCVDRPGRLYGRRWSLWDEHGNPLESEYGVAIYLMEDVESGCGISKFDDSEPDEIGVVWI